MNNESQQILEDIQQLILHNDIDIEKKFQEFDINQDKTLDEQEFYKGIKLIAPDIKDYELKKLFEIFDIDKDQTITFEEFKNTILGDLQQNKLKKPIQEVKSARILLALKQHIKSNNVDVAQLYKESDINKDCQIDKSEFHQLVLKIDPEAHQIDCDQLFSYIDENSDNKIDLQEFKTKLSN